MRHAVLLLSIVSSTLGLACQRDTGGPVQTSAAGKSGPQLELFVMSQCPYGVDVVNAAHAANQQLGGTLDVKVGFIGGGTKGNLTSMHGPAEVKGDLAQVCAIDLAPDKALDLMACQNQNPRQVDTNWRECAGKVGIDADQLATCTEGDKGQELLAAAFDVAKKRGATGSPTIYLGGKPYEGGRKPRDFMRAVCNATQGSKPSACASIPEPPPVHAVFLSDSRCKECDIRPLEPRLKGMLGGLIVKHVDYGTAEGKALYQQHIAAGGQKMLPTILLDPEVEKDTDGYPEIKRFLKPAGDSLELMMGGEFDPTAEICTNEIDDDGNGKGDCGDPACAMVDKCRQAKPKTLDMFVMSQCPYGAKAMINAKQFTDHMGGDVSLAVHFIGDLGRNGELQSMHGPAEVAEDIRERCAIEKYGSKHKFLDYLACRSQDYKSEDWQSCATSAGMDVAVIQGCYDGEGKKLLTESFALSKAYKYGASPTFMVNNKRTFRAGSAADMQREYCKDNPGLARCKDLIPAPDPASAQQAAAAGGQCN